MSKGKSSAKKPSIWYRRSRIGILIGCVLMACSLILRWKMGNSAVEASSLSWFQPTAHIWMLIALFVNLWTHPADMFEPKATHDEKDDAKT